MADILARFREELERGVWRRYVCIQCGWEWFATSLATKRDVAPRLARHLTDAHA